MGDVVKEVLRVIIVLDMFVVIDMGSGVFFVCVL